MIINEMEKGGGSLEHSQKILTWTETISTKQKQEIYYILMKEGKKEKKNPLIIESLLKCSLYLHKAKCNRIPKDTNDSLEN